jgi:hypothetical protein
MRNIIFMGVFVHGHCQTSQLNAAAGTAVLNCQITASSVCNAVAPAGFYMAGGAGISCPRGTYTDGFNAAPACTPCRTGLTTSAEGSSGSHDCKVAKAGFYVQEVQLPNTISEQQQDQPPQELGVQAAAAAVDTGSGSNDTHMEYVGVPCPIGSYQDRESEAACCTVCPNGLTTQSVGAYGLALCLAPPGVQLVPGAENVTECPRGSYKEGWNTNLCVSVSGC